MSADYKSGQPIRSEADSLDERVLIKIQDATDPSGANKGAAVSEDLLHTRNHGEDPAGTKRQHKLSEEGYSNTQGDYDATTNTRPSSNAMIAHDRNASKDETHQNKRVSAVDGSDDTTCLDVAIRDEAGQAYSSNNPLPVTLEESEGTEVHDFNETEDVAKDATTNHDYSIADTDEFEIFKIICSSAGSSKFELQVGDGAASEAFTTKAVVFGSSSNQNPEISFDRIGLKATGTANTTTIRIVCTNRDNQQTDMHTTLIGITK